MFYLDLSPYHENLCKFWKEQEPAGNFWDWVKKEYNADLVRNRRPEQWKFENEHDMLWFILRWS